MRGGDMLDAIGVVVVVVEEVEADLSPVAAVLPLEEGRRLRPGWSRACPVAIDGAEVAADLHGAFSDPTLGMVQPPSLAG